MLKVVERRKIREVVAERIQEHITAMGLRPGDRLPTEHSLAAQFGVSRVSVREATKALEFLGLLESRPGRGLTVGKVDFGRMTECLRFHSGFHDVPAEQLIEARVILETGVLPHVARRMAADPAIYGHLAAVNAEIRQTRDLSRFIALDIEFHRLLVESSGLAPLAAFNDLIQAFFQRFRESVKKAEWKAGIEGHQRIIDALRAGDLETAAGELRAHIESHGNRL
jgi:GntR family transcriptional repressor for pyruvate dehydrogenase complex